MTSFVVTLLTILAAVFVFGIVIFIHELGHFVVAKRSGVKVNEFSLGMGPRLIGFVRGETSYNLRVLPIGGFVSMEGEDEESEDERSFSRAPVGKRMLIIVAGAVMNLLLGFVVLVGLTASDELIATRRIHSFYEGATTEASGLMVNDEIIAVNGRKVFIPDDLVYEFVRVQDFTADITVLRDGKTVEVLDVKFQQKVYEDGSSGIVQDFVIVGEENNVWQTLRYAGLWTVSMARQVFLTLIDLIAGRVPINQLSGPVGIVTTISKAVTMDFATVLHLLALITINLGVFNMLPIPALDGGKFLLYLAEAVTRRRINQKLETAITVVGFALLFGLMIFVTFSDVTRLVTGG